MKINRIILIGMALCLGIMGGANILKTTVAQSDFPDVTKTFVLTEEIGRRYADSDQLLELNNETIFAYEENLWQSTLVLNQCNINVLVDDPIIQIIPRDCFVYRGEYAYVGKEYLFYVNTFAIDGTNAFANQSEVAIFDIETQYDVASLQHPSQIIQTVRPVFESSYLYVTRQNQFQYHPHITIENSSNLDTLILPKPSAITEESVTFSTSKNYFLYNPFFAGQLYNTQHVNVTDVGYDARKDKGSFFIRSDLYYKGVGYQDLSSVMGLGSAILGALLSIPSPVSTVLDLLDASIEFMLAASQDFEVVNSYGEFYKAIQYASAIEQVNAYQQLIKTIKNQIQTPASQPLLIGGKRSENQYITCKYTIGQTEAWQSTFVSAFRATVVKRHLQSIEVKKVVQGGRMQHFREVEEKSIFMQEPTIGYHIDGAYDRFKYTGNFTGNFTILTSKEAMITLFDSNQQVIQTGSNVIPMRLEKAETYYIEVEQKKAGTFEIIVELEEINKHSMKEVRLLGGEEQTFIFVPLETATVQMQSSSSGFCFRLYNSSENVLLTTESSSLSYHFIKDTTYFVVIQNKMYEEKDTVFTLANPAAIVLNQEVNTVSSTESSYYAFTAPASGKFVAVSFHSNIDLIIRKLHDASVFSYTVANAEGFNTYAFYLTQGDTIFIGAQNIQQQTFSFVIKEDTESVLSWYIDGAKNEGNSISLKQGETVRISLKIANHVIEVAKNLTMISSTSCTFNPVTGIFKVLPNAILTQSSDQAHHIFFTSNNVNYTLNIYILANINIQITEDTSIVSLAYQAGIKWKATSLNTADSFVLHIKYIFKDGTSYTHITEKAKEGSFYIPASYATIHERRTASFQVTKVDYYLYAANGSTIKTTIMNKLFNTSASSDSSFALSETKVNVFFNGGSGTKIDPYLISNERHLNNVRYATIKYSEKDPVEYVVNFFFQLQNDIHLLYFASWQPLPRFTGGGFIGNALDTKSISNVNIVKTKGDINIGFIQSIENTKIENLCFKNLKIIVHSSVFIKMISIGALTGSAVNSEIINVSLFSESYIRVGEENPSTTSNVMNNGAYSTITGGLIGNMVSGKMIGCGYSGSISSYGDIGGVVGFATSAYLENIMMDGTITLLHTTTKNFTNKDENKCIGGIVGIFDRNKIVFTKDRVSFESINLKYRPNGKTDDMELEPCSGSVVAKMTSQSILTFTSTSNIKLAQILGREFFKVPGPLWNQQYQNKNFTNKIIGLEI